MKVSIITICLNDMKGLTKTRESIICQTSQEYEHIIIDGASVDGTYEYLKKLGDSAKWISEPDNGISDAFNKGIALITGDIVLCLNAGDTLYDENVIKNVILDWKTYQVDVLSYMVERSDGQIMWCKNEEYWEKGLHAHQGIFISREAYRKLGPYNTALKSRMDYDLFLRMSQMKLTHRMIKRLVARFDTNGISQYDKRLSTAEGCGLKLIYSNNITEKDVKDLRELNCIDASPEEVAISDDKNKKYTLLLNWLDKLQSGKSIKEYFNTHGIKKVSVYGAGQLGALLIKELNHSEIEIVDLIDAIEGKYISLLCSVPIEKMNSEVDIVIVTVIDGYNEISEYIKEQKNVTVISLVELVASL